MNISNLKLDGPWPYQSDSHLKNQYYFDFPLELSQIITLNKFKYT